MYTMTIHARNLHVGDYVSGSRVVMCATDDQMTRYRVFGESVEEVYSLPADGHITITVQRFGHNG